MLLNDRGQQSCNTCAGIEQVRVMQTCGSKETVRCSARWSTPLSGGTRRLRMVCGDSHGKASVHGITWPPLDILMEMKHDHGAQRERIGGW